MLEEEQIQKIIELRHDAPYKILGPHYNKLEKTLTVNIFLPQAEHAYVITSKNNIKHKMQKIHPDGMFTINICDTEEIKYKVLVVEKDGNSNIIRDPYEIYKPCFTNTDNEYFKKGILKDLFSKLGAHILEKNGIRGVNFSVWAPNATRVSVIGSFNDWDGRRHLLESNKLSGIWEIFIPEIDYGELYKYEIRDQYGNVFVRPDPIAFKTETYPQSAAFIIDINNQYNWNDKEWMLTENKWNAPIYIHCVEFDLTCTKESADCVYNYKSLKKIVLPYILENNFNYVKLSLWNKEDVVTSYYSPNPKYGNPEDLMCFIDLSHQKGIGIILDWIPNSFSGSLNEISWFDGSRIYENIICENDNLLTFNVDLPEVNNYLLNNALFWKEIYHIDALCTDGYAYEKYINKYNSNFNLFFLIRDKNFTTNLELDEISKITQAIHQNPHSVLGLHHINDLNGNIASLVRVFIPEAISNPLILLDNNPQLIYYMNMISNNIFEALILKNPQNIKYQINVTEYGKNHTFYDPYLLNNSFLTQEDLTLFSQGINYKLYEKFGAHIKELSGNYGTNFTVWAPNARRVSVVGPFNNWDGRRNLMKLHSDAGVWELFIPEVKQDDLYKFEILPNTGPVFLKTDPFSFYTEIPPGTACIVYDEHHSYKWNDKLWIDNRSKQNIWQKPVSIYEVHAGSWVKKDNGDFLSYDELAEKLIPYVKEMGFTHIEFLPLAEHPYGPSWGYQISNFYAPTSRYGSPTDLMRLIDKCHQNNIGVILDWVPAHFPKDAHAMAWFDGTCLFEHADPRKGEHPDWGTLIFNYDRNEVKNFLIANALYWLELFHFDGLRVDAVASMLYLDYSKKDWIPNKYGGNENLEAIEFLRHVNAVVHANFPGIMMIAEESTAWPNVSRPTDIGGLGFGFKWNMGWMHDVLSYMREEPVHRCYHHHKLTFGITYAFNENFILSLSHDEVVHLKKSMLNKMPGTKQQQFANLRVLYAFMYGHPGKKLLFMGGEFGQLSEWNDAIELEWALLNDHQHKSLQQFIKDLNKLYIKENSFYQVDFNNTGFEWLDANGSTTSVVAFIRKALDPRDITIFVFNFSDKYYQKYRIGVPYPTVYRELLNSDDKKYLGEGKKTIDDYVSYELIPSHGFNFSITLNLPALSAIVLKPDHFIN